MRAGAPCLLVVVLASSSACEIVRPLDPHPDAAALAVLLVAGEREARMLAIHPHRGPGRAPPQVSAVLRGPGWAADFQHTLKLEECTLAVAWRGPARCLAADLPEPVRPGEKYRIRGTAPLGPFTGEMAMPGAPVLLEPPASLRMVIPAGFGVVEIPVRFHIGADIGTLLAEVKDVFETVEGQGEVEIPSSRLGMFPRPVEGAETDTITVIHGERPLRFSLRLLGIGRNYTNFLDKAGLDPVTRPWPDFGIEGDGTYGYFDGVTPSRTSRIILMRVEPR